MLCELNKSVQLSHGGIGGTANVAALRQKHFVTRFHLIPRITVNAPSEIILMSLIASSTYASCEIYATGRL